MQQPRHRHGHTDTVEGKSQSQVLHRLAVRDAPDVVSIHHAVQPVTYQDHVGRLDGEEPLLVEHYEFSQEVEFIGFFAPGVWQEEDYETEPFTVLEFPGGPECRYRLGPLYGYQAMALDAPPDGQGCEGKVVWLSRRCHTVTRYYTIVDNKYGPLDTGVIARARALGYDELRRRQL